MRVVTNFLYWDGAAWTYNSVHFHHYADQVTDVDAPVGGGGASSKQSLQV